MNTALSVNNLTVLYGAQQVLFNVSCTIPKGVLCAIVGPNGAGKTTFIKAVLGLIGVHAGRVSFVNSKALSSYRQAIAYIPQHRSLDLDFPIRVIDVVLMGAYAHLGLFKRFSSAEYNRAYALIAKVGLEEYVNATLGSLSGGQRQRVFLARALMQDAQLYIFDEPFVGVDVATERLIITLLQELVATGKTVLVVHHDLHTLTQYFTWMILLNKTLIAAGPIEKVFTKDTIERAYNGPLPGGIAFSGALHDA